MATANLNDMSLLCLDADINNAVASSFNAFVANI